MLRINGSIVTAALVMLGGTQGNDYSEVLRRAQQLVHRVGVTAAGTPDVRKEHWTTGEVWSVTWPKGLLVKLDAETLAPVTIHAIAELQVERGSPMPEAALINRARQLAQALGCPPDFSSRRNYVSKASFGPAEVMSIRFFAKEPINGYSAIASPHVDISLRTDTGALAEALCDLDYRMSPPPASFAVTSREARDIAVGLVKACRGASADTSGATASLMYVADNGVRVSGHRQQVSRAARKKAFVAYVVSFPKLAKPYPVFEVWIDPQTGKECGGRY